MCSYIVTYILESLPVLMYHMHRNLVPGGIWYFKSFQRECIKSIFKDWETKPGT